MAVAPVTKFKTAYGPKDRVKLTCLEVSRTKQAHKAECDINNILARYQKTGVLDFINARQGQYGDVSGVDFQNAQNLISAAKEQFAQLPSKVRNRFENDPAAYLDFVSDPANDAEAIELGLKEAAEPAVDGPSETAVQAEEPAEPA